MSDNQSKQSSTPSKPVKVIEVGKFYLLFEGSKSGHPGLIIWKNDEHNLYLAIKFGTTPNKDNMKIGYSLRKGDKENLVYKKMFLGKRKNIGKNELTEMKIDEVILKEIISKLDLLDPSYSPDVNNKDRYQYKRNIKKSPHYKGQLSCPKGTADVNTIQNDKKDVNKKSK